MKTAFFLLLACVVVAYSQFPEPTVEQARCLVDGTRNNSTLQQCQTMILSTVRQVINIAN